MNTTLIVIVTLIISLIIFRVIMMAKMKKTPLVSNHKDIMVLTEQNFNQKTKNRIVLVDFWASWCAPCRMIAPILNELADDKDLPSNSYIGKIDVQTQQALAQKFKVRNIPTLLLLKDGIEVKRFVGVKTKSFLLNEIAKIK